MSVRAGSMTGLCVEAAGLAVAGCGGSDSTARTACSAPGTKLSLGVLVRPAGALTWRNSTAVRPGGELQYRLEVSDVASNQASATLVCVRIRTCAHAIPATTYMQSLGVAD